MDIIANFVARRRLATDDTACENITEDTARVLFFFFGILAIQMVIAKIMRQRGAFYSYSKALSDSSYENQMKNDNFRKNCNPDEALATEDATTDCCAKCCANCCGNCCLELPDEKYDPEYFALVIKKRAFMGCSDIWFKDGLAFGGRLKFAKGLLEDYWLHIFNNHILLSSVMNVRGHNFGTNDVLWGYFVQNTLVFFFSSLVFYYIQLDSTRYIVNLLVVAPFSAVINMTYYYLTACPCIAKAEKEDKIYARGLVCCGKFLVVPIILLGLAMTFLGAMYSEWALSCSVSTDLFKIIGMTCQSTLAISNVLAFILTFVKMLDGMTTLEITLLCCLKYKIGEWYEDKIQFYNLQKDVHYKVHTLNLFYLLKVSVTRHIRDREEGKVIDLAIKDDGDVEMAVVATAGTPAYSSVAGDVPVPASA